ncbi:P-loop containing nucleoside triphosphate hydrolase protein [Mycena galopus ATCC 62051]|nr:P-loop containing nucleoside triphosphate hydrolase protein [Mycena galopus ATCC 62051]
MTSESDEFVNIWADASDDNQFYREWSIIGSAKHPAHELQATNALKKIYPDHSMVLTHQNILEFPEAVFLPLPNAPLINIAFFLPGARTNGKATGALIDQIVFGAFTGAWDKYDFIVYAITAGASAVAKSTFDPRVVSVGILVRHLASRCPTNPGRELLLNFGLWMYSLHEEIWVYNPGWTKDHALWESIQSADWKDVILDEGFKKDLQKDVYGFFKSEAVYKELAIPWKRGIIMHGPPGNGKTISIKVIMKTCDALGFTPLYVKSFRNGEFAIQQVFDKARQESPCVIVLEDLDALINDSNRSFFLNQLDGLQGNDGLLVIGTTNHFDRLDPGLSSRPSRFDRKYKFDDPTWEERVLYVKYWQNKLKDNKDIDFPNTLVDEVADETKDFSFAYLKEAFVSCLVTLAGWEGDDKPSFGSALKAQIRTLRKQLDKTKSTEAGAERDFRPLFDTISDAAPARTVFLASTSNFAGTQPQDERDFLVLDNLQQPGHGNISELMAQMTVTRFEEMLSALPTPSARDSTPAQIVGVAHSPLE